MSAAIVAAIITGTFSFIGSIIALIASNKHSASEMDKKIAVLDTKMDSMKEDIRSHNQYAKMFSENIPAIKQHMTDTDRRLDNIERRLA